MSSGGAELSVHNAEHGVAHARGLSEKLEEREDEAR